MKKYTGKGVCEGIAIGRISVLHRHRTESVKLHVGDAKQELKRLETAKQRALSQIQEIYSRALEEVGDTQAQIFEIHGMMLEDEDFNDAIRSIIENEKVNAEYAVTAAAEQFRKLFSEMEDAYLQARAADVADIADRLLRNLRDSSESGEIPQEKVILCAEDFTPSETVMLDKRQVLAFVTAHGSPNSHTAILARSMNIPAIIGVGEDFLREISEGETAVADGQTGELWISPDAPTISQLRCRKEENEEKQALLQKLRGKENITLDGRKIRIYANIGSTAQLSAVKESDAQGIGLFRTEFLYLERCTYPTEEQQLAVYERVLEEMDGKRVIFRTLDIGADKQAEYFGLDAEENPALGMRGIRLCLTRPQLFRTQLRALYRASVHGKMGIMFPMIASAEELSQCLAICKSVREELRGEGVEISPCTEHGVMLETPAAALISDRLAPMVDFFSVGTNDLTQYTLACDRRNPALAQFCNPHHEAILRLIANAAHQAHRHGAWIGICGELASDVALTETFLRMGIDELSVSPPYVLRLRETVRGLDLSE